jgi:hypothetical protein
MTTLDRVMLLLNRWFSHISDVFGSFGFSESAIESHKKIQKKEGIYFTRKRSLKKKDFLGF